MSVRVVNYKSIINTQTQIREKNKVNSCIVKDTDIVHWISHIAVYRMIYYPFDSVEYEPERDGVYKTLTKQ